MTDSDRNLNQTELTKKDIRNLEARARREHERNGWRIEKSRARNPSNPTYGRYRMTDLDGKVANNGSRRHGYNITLDDLKKWYLWPR
jgi:hypothetical protein